MYEEGKGVPEDYESAVKWYTRASEQNHGRARLNLGKMYYGGKGVSQSYKTAVDLFRDLEDHGSWIKLDAQCILSEYNERVTQNYNEALKSYKVMLKSEDL